MIRSALGQGSAMEEAVIARVFDGAGGSVLRDDIELAPGAGERFDTEVTLPRTAIEPLMIAGKPMLVPVLVFDVTYHWEGDADAFGQTAGSYVLGRATASGTGRSEERRVGEECLSTGSFRGVPHPLKRKQQQQTKYI